MQASLPALIPVQVQGLFQSYLGLPPFQEIRFNSFVQPREFSESIPIVFRISYLMSGMLVEPPDVLN